MVRLLRQNRAMSQDQQHPDADLHQQVESLRATVAKRGADMDSLHERADASDERADEIQTRADKAELRTDDLDARADLADLRADASEGRSRDDRLRIYDLEERGDVDRAMIAELQAEGLVSQAHAENLKAALRTSRTIGAALGIVMANRRVTESDAFKILSRASQNTNRRLRLVAHDVVTTGEVPQLPEG